MHKNLISPYKIIFLFQYSAFATIIGTLGPLFYNLNLSIIKPNKIHILLDLSWLRVVFFFLKKNYEKPDGKKPRGASLDTIEMQSADERGEPSLVPRGFTQFGFS